ncbi:MAG: hydrogenase formation protein HypD [Oscillospiraceae bacterium]|nr:hydrogenase formation protein HypD [Oscillospiraceae bacterium]
MNCENYNARKAIERIEKMNLGHIRIMEVCGTHTMAIAKSGLRGALPGNIELLSGPGCPVCVTPPEVIDAVISLAEQKNVTVATYGDMIKVPGSVPAKSLATARAHGAEISVVYSALDAVDIAERTPWREVVFLGVGFETTAPGTAAAIKVAKERGVSNFSVFSLLKTVEPALRALISQDGFNISGFLCPGHVATIIGARGFEFLARDYGLPCVVAGFEPREILYATEKLLLQIEQNSPKIENAYPDGATFEGNTLAAKMTEAVFEPTDALWRGLGEIPASGLSLREEFSEFDAVKKLGITYEKNEKSSPCRCGDVICGKLSPRSCPLFGRACTPENPVGPCMVSGEGACAAYYKYSE